MIKNYNRKVALYFCTYSFFLSSSTISSTNKKSNNNEVSQIEEKQKTKVKEKYNLLIQLKRDFYRAVRILGEKTIFWLAIFGYLKWYGGLIGYDFFKMIILFLFVDFFIILIDNLVYYLLLDYLEEKPIGVLFLRLLASVVTAAYFSTMIYLTFGTMPMKYTVPVTGTIAETTDAFWVSFFFRNYLTFLIVSL